MKPITVHRQCGATLLEALVAILIFSFGVLAIIGLQAASIRNTTQAKMRADAAFLANQIIGVMWADNHANLLSYAHRADGTDCGISGTDSGNARVISWIGSTTTSGTILGTLPGSATAKPRITVDSATHLVTVTVCWRGPQDATPHSYVTAAQING